MTHSPSPTHRRPARLILLGAVAAITVGSLAWIAWIDPAARLARRTCVEATVDLDRARGTAGQDAAQRYFDEACGARPPR